MAAASHDPALGAMFELSGKTALVVGGTAGVGWAIAELFARAGAKVFAVDTGEAVARPEAADVPHAIAFGECDLLDERSVEAVVKRAIDDLGGIDILVNASVLFTNATLAETSIEQWDRTHGINLRGAFLATRAAVPSMQARGGGRIINISTIGSVHPMLYGNFAYSSSRAGLNHFTRNCAFDFAADHITANVILTGGITHQALEAANPVSGPGVDAPRHIGGYGTPGDVAALALLLAGPSGRYISGQAIAVDGGFLVG
jgi:NAD(P)-dependent dehydrogenase (short-subunit alcohol dehydrogenase family)